MLTQYAGIGAILIVAIAFPLIVLLTSSLIRPKKAEKYKYDIYECGLETQGETWIQFKTSYFLFALAFMVFDVETVFLYPIAVKFQELGFFEISAVFIFMVILILGLWYDWKEGALEWD